MTGAVLLAILAACAVIAAHALSRARWTWNTPRTAIALWQALGLAWGVATVGALLGAGLSPYGRGIAGSLPLLAEDLRTGAAAARLGAVHLSALLCGFSLVAVLVAMLATALVGVVRVRSRHRALLALVARGQPGVPDALVLDHPAAAAYCVPGMRSTVVVSAGTVKLLDRAELAAVLAHERAHARERHDLVLLPFASLRQIFPRIPVVRRSLDAVELLIEMAADDRARRHRSGRELATALLRFAAARPARAPSGTLGVLAADVFDMPILARVRRLLEPPGTPPARAAALRAATLAVAAVTAGAPLLLYVLP